MQYSKNITLRLTSGFLIFAKVTETTIITTSYQLGLHQVQIFTDTWYFSGNGIHIAIGRYKYYYCPAVQSVRIALI